MTTKAKKHSPRVHKAAKAVHSAMKEAASPDAPDLSLQQLIAALGPEIDGIDDQDDDSDDLMKTDDAALDA